MIDQYKDPQWSGKVPKKMRYHKGYSITEDDVWEVHRRVCEIDPCDNCLDERDEMALDRRYNRYW